MALRLVGSMLKETVSGLYLGKSAVASTYGAAAALAILLPWVYYSVRSCSSGPSSRESMRGASDPGSFLQRARGPLANL